MGVVPGVVVYYGGSIAHASELVAKVPPRQYLAIRRSVLAQPPVALSVLIDDNSVTVF